MSTPKAQYVVDPEDPRAPSAEIWEGMTAAERARVLAILPSEIERAGPPEGDPHFNAKVGAREALDRFFARVGRKVYVACELPVYYPGERMFAPDVIAVLDVELKERMHWTVSHEGRGLDFALEIHVAGDRKKDMERNAAWLAALGIPEYFAFDRGRGRLFGFRLAESGKTYQPIVPQHGRYSSHVLGLELAVEDKRLRFYVGTAPLPQADELLAKLEGMVDGLEERAVQAEARAEREERLRMEQEGLRALEEERRIDAERARIDAERARIDAEKRLADALAEIARLKGERP
jgi:Uma2 family endonuclease